MVGVGKGPTKAVKTGARHTYARYLLLPATLKRSFQTESRDFDDIKCGIIEFRNGLDVILSLAREGLGADYNESDKDSFKES